MPVRQLPASPSLDHLKYQAKDLRKNHAAHDPAAAQLLREFHPRFHNLTDRGIFAAKLSLSDAQLAIAREAGFPSWPKLKRRVEKPVESDRLDLKHHERITDPIFRRAVDLIDAGDAAALRAHLEQHPGLQKRRVVFEGMNYFENPSLLEFIAENPVRQGKMPANIVDVAKVILDAGVDKDAIDVTLALVATGSVPHACRQARPLIELLCDRGADFKDLGRTVALHGEMDALDALLSRGAKLDLPVAAALGRVEDVRRMLPRASGEDRHLAFALASQRAQIEVVRILLAAGERPSRFNPVGGHSHCTPLHQAAINNDFAMVRLFLEHGADLHLKDVLWRGTPADWAHHMGLTEMENFLRSQMKPATGAVS